MKCQICNNNEGNKSILVKEMQQGFREEFEYIECSNCGCLFIKEIPENIDKYYDIDYVPHNNKITLKNKIEDKIFGMYLTNNKLVKFIYRKNVSITTKFWSDLSANGIMKKKFINIRCGLWRWKIFNCSEKRRF